MRYTFIALLLLLSFGCSPKNNSPYYITEDCIKSHIRNEYKFHYGFSFIKCKYCWHYGNVTTTICDSMVTDTVWVK